jgi:hypothetical protein
LNEINSSVKDGSYEKINEWWFIKRKEIDIEKHKLIEEAYSSGIYDTDELLKKINEYEDQSDLSKLQCAMIYLLLRIFCFKNKGN